jgi:hypothetical protein
MSESDAASRIDRLLDAIELVEADRRKEACDLLRDLIREDNDFEDAWLWMAVAVDSMDKSQVCLDNVLRINPGNAQAAGALFWLRKDEMKMRRRHSQLRYRRDMSLGFMWLLSIGLLYAVVFLTPMHWREPEGHNAVPPPPVPTDFASTQSADDSDLPARSTPPQRWLPAEDSDY